MSCLQKQLHVSRTCTHSPKKQWSCRPTAVTNKKARCYGSQRRCSRLGAAESDVDLSADELEERMEAFMRKQAEQESGGVVAAEPQPSKVLGADEVTEEQAKQLCRDITKAIRTLEKQRDMNVNEIKLIIAIEDPRSKERRESMGIEDNDGGVSRDEMASTLLEVTEGRIPKDRIALREVWREISSWPFLDADTAKIQEEAGSEANYAGITKTGVREDEAARPRPMQRDKSELPQGIADLLPDWVGYGFLYGLSGIPVFLVIAVVTLFFFSSLR